MKKSDPNFSCVEKLMKFKVCCVRIQIRNKAFAQIFSIIKSSVIYLPDRVI